MMTLTIWMQLLVIYLNIQLIHIHLTTIQAFFRNLIGLEFESRISCSIGRTNLVSNSNVCRRFNLIQLQI